MQYDEDDDGEAAPYSGQDGLENDSEDPTEGDGGPNNKNNQLGVDSQTGVDEEEELKMKIVLYYHTLVSRQI